MAIQGQKIELTKNHLFNVAGVALLGLGFYLAVKSSFAPKPETPLCETRYAGGVLFSFTRSNGSVLTPEDLQARLGGLDRGLVRNARIVKDEGVPFGHALEVQLRRAGREETEQDKSGIGFTWLPQKLASATAACLSYSVWTPEDFKPGDGGVLPGFVSDTVGEDPTAMPENLPPQAEPAPPNPENPEEAPAVKLQSFATMPQWRSDGALLLWQTPNTGHRGLVGLDPAKASLKPGRWVRIEEEVILNTPGQPNGILRMWVDGKIVHERFDLGFRKDEVQSFQAIVGNVHNMRYGAWTGSPVDTRLRLSPLELRLQ